MNFPPFSSLPFSNKGSLPEIAFPDTDSTSFFDGKYIRNILRQRLGQDASAEWFEPLSFSLTGGKEKILTITFPHEFFFRWYEEQGLPKLEKTVREALGFHTHIRYDWPHRHDHCPPTPPFSCVLSRTMRLTSNFDNFLSGGRNRDSVTLFRKALLQTPSVILLNGVTGTGKSHLLHAAAYELNSRFPQKISFLSCEELISWYRRSPDSLHKIFQECKALLVDDLQMLEGREKLQQELAVLLDSFSGRTFFIGALSRESAPLIPSLYDRLCSHLVLKLAEPDLDIRMRFAQVQMKKAGLPEHHGTALLLARRYLRLRHIQGMLEHVRLRYEQNGNLPSDAELTQLLDKNGPTPLVDVHSILAAVASRYGCTSSQLCENKRDIHLALPRQIAMYLCRRLLGESYPSLGLIFGGKDHSTVMYSVKKIEKIKVTNKDIHMQITELTKQCLNGNSRGGTPA